jgi:hypothetical protein
MKSFDIRSVLATAAMALLGACGGGAGTDPADGHASTAALMVLGNAPVADCEAEGCNRPRIIDGLAEQYRAGAIEQQAQPADQVQPGAPLPAPIPGQAAPTEAAPAAAGQS